jgi:uncharacterized protein (DUF1800 family)
MLAPLPQKQWNSATAAHLLNRAGFGGSPSDIERVRQLGLYNAVSWLVDYEHSPDDTPAPDWAQPDPQDFKMREAINKEQDPDTKRQFGLQYLARQGQRMMELRYWWLRRMAVGPRPFLEKMTLFWHGHFATSSDKVVSGFVMYTQNEIFRRYALGTFYDLLVAVSQDPAMLLYLDGAGSRKEHPNENFGREVMELFTLGEGHYTEKDIQQSAKAYTGWTITQYTEEKDYRPELHSEETKTFLGQTGNFTGEDALRIICNQPQCALFLTKKIWRYFVQDEPPDAIVQALATRFQSTGLNLRDLMRTIFLSQEFYAPDVIKSQIKSPVQWLIQTTHQLEAALPPPPMALSMISALGQMLLQPPNVKGWDGGMAWISTTTLLSRFNYAAALVEGDMVNFLPLQYEMNAIQHTLLGWDDPRSRQFALDTIGPASVMNLFTPAQLSHPDQLLAALQDRFLHGPIKPERLKPLRDFLASKPQIDEPSLRKAIRLVMCTPEYQLT